MRWKIRVYIHYKESQQNKVIPASPSFVDVFACVLSCSFANRTRGPTCQRKHHIRVQHLQIAHHHCSYICITSAALHIVCAKTLRTNNHVFQMGEWITNKKIADLTKKINTFAAATTTTKNNSNINHYQLAITYIIHPAQTLRGARNITSSSVCAVGIQ